MGEGNLTSNQLPEELEQIQAETGSSATDRASGQEVNRRSPTDYRRMRRQDERALLAAVIVFLLFVGGGLIFLIYGAGALVTGLACLLFGVGLLLLLWLIVTGIERWANR